MGLIGLIPVALAASGSGKPSRDSSIDWRGELLFDGRPIPGTILYGRMYVIPGNTAVNISPGTKLLFEEGYGLAVLGDFQARGSAEEPIVASSIEKNTQWVGLLLLGGRNYTLRYMVIEAFQEVGLLVYWSYATLEHIRLRSASAPIGLWFRWSSGSLTDIVADLRMNGALRLYMSPKVELLAAGIGIYAEECSNLFVSNSRLLCRGLPGSSVIGVYSANSTDIQLSRCSIQVSGRARNYRILPESPSLKQFPQSIPDVKLRELTVPCGGEAIALAFCHLSSEIRIDSCSLIAESVGTSDLGIGGLACATFLAGGCQNISITNTSCVARGMQGASAYGMWLSANISEIGSEHVEILSSTGCRGVCAGLWISDGVERTRFINAVIRSEAGSGSIDHPDGGSAVGAVLQHATDIVFQNTVISAYGGQGLEASQQRPRAGSGGNAIAAALEDSSISTTNVTFAAYGGDGGDATAPDTVPGLGGKAHVFLLVNSRISGQYALIEQDGNPGNPPPQQSKQKQSSPL